MPRLEPWARSRVAAAPTATSYANNTFYIPFCFGVPYIKLSVQAFCLQTEPTGPLHFCELCTIASIIILPAETEPIRTRHKDVVFAIASSIILPARTEPIRIRDKNVVSASGGAPPPPTPPRFFLNREGLLSRTWHHQQELEHRTMNKNYVKHIVVIELIKAHDAGILLANGEGCVYSNPRFFFLRPARPLQVSSCREIDVVFESGGGCAPPPPPNPPAVFLSSAGLLSRTSHHQEELRQAHACIIFPASKDRTHQGV